MALCLLLQQHREQLHKHLVDAGLFNGESNHGCKGRMQEYAAEGMDHAASGTVAQIKSVATIERYLSRHEVCQSHAGKLSVKAMNIWL